MGSLFGLRRRQTCVARFAISSCSCGETNVTGREIAVAPRVSGRRRKVDVTRASRPKRVWTQAPKRAPRSLPPSRPLLLTRWASFSSSPGSASRAVFNRLTTCSGVFRFLNNEDRPSCIVDEEGILPAVCPPSSGRAQSAQARSSLRAVRRICSTHAQPSTVSSSGRASASRGVSARAEPSALTAEWTGNAQPKPEILTQIKQVAVWKLHKRHC